MKVLNQEAIRRMISGGTSGAASVSVGGGGDGGLTPAWVEGNYISKSFFSQLFTIHGTKTVTDPQTGTTTEEEVEITPNQLIDDEYDVTDVEVKFGLWTQQFLSALGKNSSGGGGGGDTLTEPLASINNAGLGTPTAAGQVITWNGSEWIFDIPQGGGGGGVTLNNVLESINNTTFQSATPLSAGQAIVWDGTKWTFGTAGGGTDLNAVWDSLKAEDSNKQIDLSHLTNALAGYATQSWVTSQGYLTELPSHNHDSRYKFGTIGIGTVQITLGGTTKSVLTSHQSLADYVKTIQLGTNGTVYSPTSGKITLPAYPTTLPASDVYSWAKAANKPSYSFSEIANHPTTLAGYGITDALPLSGGTMTGQIYSTVGAGSWIEGRDKALIRKGITNTTSWWPILSVKTADGSWEMGAISDKDNVKNALVLSYATDENYNANTNNVMRILFPKSAGTLALLSDNVASATRLASNDTKTLLGNTYWSSGQPQNVGTSWSDTAHISYISNITMKGTLNGVTTIEMNNNGNGYLQGCGGVIDFHYNASTDDYTSRIIEDKNGRLNFNGTAFIYKSNKPASTSDFPGGALNAKTDWGGYSFRNVFTNNSLFENTLFLRTDLYMKTNTGIRIKNYAGDNVMALSLESNSSNNSIVVGAGAHNVAGISTYIRGYSVNFQTANGAGSTTVGHFDNEGNFIIDVAGKTLYMNDGTTTRNMMGINIPATYFHVCYGATESDWQTRIYGGGGDGKGIAFYHGSNTLAAGISGGDHSLVAYYHIKLTNNNTSLFTRNTATNAVDTIKMDSNNILNFGLGCNTYNHETRIYGGATAGIGFFCGSSEVARIHKDNARQGIRIGDGLLSWDSNNNAFKVSKIDGQGNEVAANLYALGGVSALGFTAPQSSLDAFHIDYLTSTNVSTQTIDVATKINLGSSNCYIQGSSGGSVTINAPSGLTLGSSNVVADPTGGLRAIRFYLNSSTWLYLEGASLKISNGTTTKTITTL